MGEGLIDKWIQCTTFVEHIEEKDESKVEEIKGWAEQLEKAKREVDVSYLNFRNQVLGEFSKFK